MRHGSYHGRQVTSVRNLANRSPCWGENTQQLANLHTTYGAIGPWFLGSSCSSRIVRNTPYRYKRYTGRQEPNIATSTRSAGNILDQLYSCKSVACNTPATRSPGSRNIELMSKNIVVPHSLMYMYARLCSQVQTVAKPQVAKRIERQCVLGCNARISPRQEY